jgi:polyhydroxybutyrate depolymerase
MGSEFSDICCAIAARKAAAFCVGVLGARLLLGCAEGVPDDAWGAPRSSESGAVETGTGADPGAAGAPGPPSASLPGVATPVAPPPATQTAGNGGSPPVSPSPAAGSAGVPGSPGTGPAGTGGAGAGGAGTNGAGTSGAAGAGGAGAAGAGTTGAPAPLSPPEEDEDAPTASTGCTAASLDAGDHTVVLDIASARRVYLAHLPPQADSSTPLPLLVVMHGWAQTAAGARTAFGVNASADAEGFIAVYPQGQGNTWNAGTCCGGNVEDSVAFIRSVVEDVAAKSCVDRRRIYASGMGNGGMMAFRLACEAADLFAASAPVAGDIRIPACDPTRPIALIAFSGTADPLVPYIGAVTSVNTLRDRFHCEADASVQLLFPDRCETYSGCDADIEVAHCTDLAGQHVWTGGPGLRVNPVMWQFLSRFRLPR